MLPVQLLLVTGLSILPDLDIILAVLFKDMETYHNNFSHSLFFGAIVSLVCAGGFYGIYHGRFWFWFLISFLSYSLHIGMDIFTGSRGVLLFWPFLQERVASPVKLFVGVQWGLGWFTIWHVWTILSEGAFVTILLFVTHKIIQRRSKKMKLNSPITPLQGGDQ
jgi:membrane-bound metal-dependent hydrolase YbcI (DUF457 family)